MNPRFRAWTPEDEHRLREGVAADEPWEGIAESIGRSVDAVKVRAQRLGVSRDSDFDPEQVEDPRERWGHGPRGGAYWTRERTEAALRAYVEECAAVGRMLPPGNDEYNAIKRGRADLPTWVPLRRHMFTETRPSLGHVWLGLGAPKHLVKSLAGPWTDDEHDFLLSNAGTLRLVDIARRLHRTYAACKRRLYDYGTTARDNQGFMSMQQVADEYGCDVTRVRRFVQMGILPATLRHGNRYEIDPVDCEAVADALRAPAARGKGWRYVDGRPVPPKVKQRRAPDVITRVRPRGSGVAA